MLVDALLLQSVDDVGRHAGIDRCLDRGALSLWSTNMATGRFTAAAHLEHLLEHVAAGIFQVDQDDVGIDRVDAREQVRCFGDTFDLSKPGLAQALFQDGRTDGTLIDDRDLQG